MFIDFLVDVFRENSEKDAVIWHNKNYSYQMLIDKIDYWDEYLDQNHVNPGTVIIVEGDFSPSSITLILALIERSCIIVPLTVSISAKRDEFIEIAQGEVILAIDENDQVRLLRSSNITSHHLLRQLIDIGHPGLILFSSGSTGKNKAAVHDLVGILNKFKIRRIARRAITFLLYDHIGGFNTMLYQLSNGGCIVTAQERDPDTVLQIIEKYKVELLPTSPTFVNMILLSEAYKRYDLSSLKMVTYGTEPMHESTLRCFHELFPSIQLLQTYGLSEIGIMRSKSLTSDSLWVKIGGEGFETRVVDEILQIKAESAMLGYLNAPSPFTEDGWFNTGDRVEISGEYLKILGRQSEIINIGGQKVYPAEIESVIQEMENIAEVSVYGEKNAIMGQIVCASIRLRQKEEQKEIFHKIRKYCHGRLQKFQIPVKIKIVENDLHSNRFKKMRREGA